MTTEINFLRVENEKLRQYIYLLECEREFRKRIFEIEQNFTNPSDSSLLVNPLINRLEKISSEKLILKNELRLK